MMPDIQIQLVYTEIRLTLRAFGAIQCYTTYSLSELQVRYYMENSYELAQLPDLVAPGSAHLHMRFRIFNFHYARHSSIS